MRHIDIVIEGERAYERAKERIAEKTADTDPERVRSVRVEMEIAEEEPATLPGGEPSDGVASGNGGNGGNGDERQLKEVTEGSQGFHVLAALDAADEPLTSTEAAEVTGIDSAASVLSRLWRQKLADREKDTREDGGLRYLYRPSAYGRALVQRHAIGEADADADTADTAPGE